MQGGNYKRGMDSNYAGMKREIKDKRNTEGGMKAGTKGGMEGLGSKGGRERRREEEGTEGRGEGRR